MSKRLSVISVTAICALTALIQSPRVCLADEVEKEVTLQRIFIPAHGYDDNDNVQIFIEGMLPNGCYSARDPVIEKSSANLISVKQFAKRMTDGTCSVADENLPETWKFPTRFSKEYYLGTLSAGTYTLNFATASGFKTARSFLVTAAPFATIDNLAYAPVQNAYIPESVNSESALSVALTGELSSNCLKVVDDVEIEKIDDVIVLLPRVELMGTGCEYSPNSFVKNVTLPFQLKKGRYLLHIRTTGGGSLNRPFSVR